ncbi:MAG: hypothetical protein IPK53_09925 [bacterium]|nr:hypothetical protein [bacterium]
MKKSSPLQNEQSRLQALYQYNILDTLPEKAFDDVTLLATTFVTRPLPWSPLSTATGSGLNPK